MTYDKIRIKKLRDRMEYVTLSMVRLLQQRTKISREIGELKRLSGLSVTDGAREVALRQQIIEDAVNEGIPQDMVARFLNHLLNESAIVQLQDGPTHLSVFARAKAMELEGRHIVHMEVGQPDFGPPEAAGEALLEGFRAGHVRYGLPAGDAALRGALAEDVGRRYGIKSSTDNIIVTPGARFGVFAAITTMLNPGDEIIIMEPAWPAYKEAAIYRGAKPHVIHTTLENGWEPTAESIEWSLTPQTRMLVLSYPSNPTGKILPPKLLDEIMNMAIDRGIYVLSDEIYRDYTMRGRHRSILEYSYNKCIVTQSFSKSHSMAGMRIGYAVSSPDIIERMTAASALCLTGVAGVIQYAALKSLDYDTAQNVETIRKRLDVIEAGARRAGLEFLPPDGGMYVFGRVPGVDGMEVVDRCLEEGLALAPGTGFGHYPEFLRISAGTEEAETGMNILYDVLRKHTWKR